MSSELQMRLAIKYAFDKLSTSRWREAIRSGEISPEAAAKIQAYVGLPPKEWAKRYRAGIARAMQRHNVASFRVSPREAEQLKALSTGLAATIVQSPVFTSLTAPGEYTVIYQPRWVRQLAQMAGVPESMARKAKPLIAHHELREVLRSSKPSRFMSHVSPLIPIEDIRESRLFGPHAQKFFSKMRQPELAPIENIVQKRFGRMYLPREALPRLGAELMRRSRETEMQKMMTAFSGLFARRASPPSFPPFLSRPAPPPAKPSFLQRWWRWLLRR